MVVFGTLLAGESLTPQVNDQVLFVGWDRTVEGIASVGDACGIYAIASSKSASFNGTTLVCESPSALVWTSFSLRREAKAQRVEITGALRAVTVRGAE
ncbi:MAG: hypothetical protein ACI915_005598 [Gammaproteobacteria bacterium]